MLIFYIYNYNYIINIYCRKTIQMKELQIIFGRKNVIIFALWMILTSSSFASNQSEEDVLAEAQSSKKFTVSPLAPPANSEYVQWQHNQYIKGRRLNLAGILIFSSSIPEVFKSNMNHGNIFYNIIYGVAYNLVSEGIKTATWSRYTHIGILLKDHFDSKRLYCLEAGQPVTKKFRHLAPQVYLTPLHEVVASYPGSVEQRNLVWDKKEEEYPNITNMIEEYLGRSFRKNPAEICRLFMRCNKTVDRRYFFCIELAAVILQRLAYLPENPPASNYTPRDFSYDLENLNLFKVNLGESTYLKRIPSCYSQRKMIKS